MKKLIIILLIIMPLNIKAISARSFIVMDLDSKRILQANNIHEKRLIASTTKIMTAIVAIENGDLDKMVIVNSDVLKSYGSAIYLEVGEQITLRDLLYGLLLRSGNDASIMIANVIAGNMTNFTNLMNITAENIGLKNTIFYNAHGLEDKNGVGNLSTCYDMALLTKYAMENSTFREIFGTKKHVAKTNYKTYQWLNKNRLLHKLGFITGGKTGFTKRARRTLVTTASKNNLNLVIVTLNDPNDFQDHESLYKSFFAKYKSLTLIKKNKFKIKKEKVYQKHKLYINNDVKIPITKDESKKIKIKYNLVQNKSCFNNTKVGVIKVYLDNKLINEENIYVKCSKPSLNWWQRLIRRWQK